LFEVPLYAPGPREQRKKIVVNEQLLKIVDGFA
jgi:hypothetical protein